MVYPRALDKMLKVGQVARDYKALTVLSNILVNLARRVLPNMPVAGRILLGVRGGTAPNRRVRRSNLPPRRRVCCKSKGVFGKRSV